MKAQIYYKPHIVLALILGLWLTLFLTIVGPYDTAELSLAWRASVMYGYGLILFISYLLLIPIQSKIWELFKPNLLTYEGLMICLILLLSWPASFWYYTTPSINGDYGFARFSIEIYVPTLIIFTPMMIYGRWFINKKYKAPKSKNEVRNEIQKSKGFIPQLEQLMDERVYLNPELSLSELSRLVGVNSKLLSQGINHHYGLNFNDFINEKRVEAVIESVKNGQHQKQTLLAVAEDCGFKSQATFNRAFRKKTGLTPGEYAKKLNL